MPSSRYLDEIESQLRSSPTHAAEYRGRIDPDILNTAYGLLCDRYPILRSRIRSIGKRFQLAVSDGQPPGLLVIDGDESALEREANAEWSPELATAKLMLIRSEEKGFVALRMDHAIADGSAKVAIFRDLWVLYTGLMTGADISIDEEPLPLAPCEILRERNHIGCVEIFEKSLTRQPVQLSETISRYVDLDAQHTTNLIENARFQGVTVHALICGTILSSLRDYALDVGEYLMSCMSAVNLRNHVVPTVGATETTNLLGIHRAELSADRNESPATLARRVKGELDRAVSHRELVPVDLTQVLCSGVETPLPQRLATMLISNPGVISSFSHPPGLEIVDFRPCIPLQTPAVFSEYGAYTYDGKLKLRCTYPRREFTEEDVDVLVGTIFERLQQQPC